MPLSEQNQNTIIEKFTTLQGFEFAFYVMLIVLILSIAGGIKYIHFILTEIKLKISIMAEPMEQLIKDAIKRLEK